eukprot:TRINITY_DN20784_c0_g1_i1.p1 TRINITY_DN20784_c0_g1~~TRINITY_DN20784_c0_g1_i1.p1  ORF type:complete len:157 (-),score=10.12 TRINITY_DN20784_c0_g1_i1:74-544(-)
MAWNVAEDVDAETGDSSFCSYFAVTRSWCGTIQFYPGGAFLISHLPIVGRWALSPSDDGEVVVLELRIEGGMSGISTPKPGERLVFIAKPPSLTTFRAGPSLLRLTSGSPLTLPCDIAEPNIYKRQRYLLFSSVGEQCLPAVKESWFAEPSAVVPA